MDKTSLQTFISVAENQSFSLAASALFMTQPAISKRIKLLEQELNCRLLDRGAKNIILTQAGIELLPRARALLKEMESCKQLMTDLSGQTMGALSLATSHHIGLHRLPPVLQKFVEKHPKVELDLNFMDSEDACQAVDNNEMEIAIVTLPNKQWKNLSTQHVWTDHLVITCNQQHPLNTLATVKLSDLLDHPAILPSKGTFTRNIIEETLKSKLSSLKISMETNYLETIKMLVSVGLGWSILPQNMVQNQYDLVTLNVDEFIAQRELGCVTNKHRTLSNPASALIELLTQQ